MGGMPDSISSGSVPPWAMTRRSFCRCSGMAVVAVANVMTMRPERRSFRDAGASLYGTWPMRVPAILSRIPSARCWDEPTPVLEQSRPPGSARIGPLQVGPGTMCENSMTRSPWSGRVLSTRGSPARRRCVPWPPAARARRRSGSPSRCRHRANGRGSAPPPDSERPTAAATLSPASGRPATPSRSASVTRKPPPSWRPLRH